MIDKGFDLSPERKAALGRGFERLIAECVEAEDKALDEVRFALAVSIIGAIENAAPLAEKSLAELRVVAEEVEKLLGYIKMQLKGHADDNSNAN